MIEAKAWLGSALGIVVLAGLLVAVQSQSASAYHAPGRHWPHEGLTHSQIYFVDYTGPNWPVSSSVYKWNEAEGVDSYYASTCPNYNLHCVNVYEYNAADNHYGYTAIGSIDPSNHFTSGTVHLNNYYTHNDTQFRKTRLPVTNSVIYLALIIGRVPGVA